MWCIAYILCHMIFILAFLIYTCLNVCICLHIYTNAHTNVYTYKYTSSQLDLVCRNKTTHLNSARFIESPLKIQHFFLDLSHTFRSKWIYLDPFIKSAMFPKPHAYSVPCDTLCSTKEFITEGTSAVHSSTDLKQESFAMSSIKSNTET